MVLRPPTSRLGTIVGLAGLAAVAGCQAPRGPTSVDSDDPDLKVLAIKRDVADHDEHDEPALVHDLDDRDAAVRFYAIQGLRRLSGQDLGYRYFDDEAARRPAVDRWRAWVAAHPAVP